MGKEAELMKLAKYFVNRNGQSMTSLLVGLAIMGCVGAGAAKLSQSAVITEQSLSVKNSVALSMDALADEIRTQTRYSELSAKYGGKTFDLGDGGEFTVKTSVRKICNTSSANCDATHVDIEIVDKVTGEVVLKQTVTRVYTHFEESAIAFASSQEKELPADAIAMRYVVDGVGGNNGTTYDGHGYDLKVNSEACPYDYKPNTASPRPNGCVACPSPTWKQYRNGDCSLFTCPPGQKANTAGNGCEAIECGTNETLSGDNCIPKPGCSNNLSGYDSNDLCWVGVKYIGMASFNTGNSFRIPKKIAQKHNYPCYSDARSGVSNPVLLGNNGILVLNGKTNYVFVVTYTMMNGETVGYLDRPVCW